MRTLIFILAAAIICTTASAQINVNDMIKKRMEQQQAKQNSGAQTGAETQPSSVKVEDDNSPFVPNKFLGSYRMEMHFFKKGVEEKKSPTNARYAFKEDMTAMNIKQTDENAHDMRMIYDLKNKVQYMLMDDGKNKTAMKQKLKTITVDSDKQKETSEMKVTMTDEYKVIDGHNCRKVTGENEESKGEWWVAQDVDIDMMEVMRTVQMKGRSRDEYAKFGGKGLPMEMIWEKKDGSDKLVMNTKDVLIGSPDASNFDISGYEVTDMTSMPGFGH